MGLVIQSDYIKDRLHKLEIIEQLSGKTADEIIELLDSGWMIHSPNPSMSVSEYLSKHA